MCLLDEPLVDSHIIPRSFYRIDRNDPRPARLISNVPGEHPRRLRIGEYDQIVCETCERLFGAWDQYANNILLQSTENRRDVLDNGEVIAQLIENFDYHDLKLFFLSLLWRVSISNRPTFQQIALGPHEDVLRNLILDRSTGQFADYSILISQFDANTPILNPHYERFDGIRYVRVYLANYVAYIKVDRQPPPRGTMSDFAMHPERPLCIIVRDFRGSSEFSVLRQMLADNPRLLHNRPE